MQTIDNGEGVVNALLARACPNQTGLACTRHPCVCQRHGYKPRLVAVPGSATTPRKILFRTRLGVVK